MAKAYILKTAGQIITLNCMAHLSGGRLIIKASQQESVSIVCLHIDTAISYEIAFSNKSSAFGFAPSGMSLIQLNIDDYNGLKKSRATKSRPVIEK